MGCVAVKANIVIYEGGTFDQEFIWETGSPLTAVNITGFTAVFTVRAKAIDTAALISITEGTSPWAADADSGVYIDTPETGKYKIYVNDTDTAGICIAHVDVKGVYDLFLTSAAGEVLFKQYGKALLKYAVTR